MIKFFTIAFLALASMPSFGQVSSGLSSPNSIVLVTNAGTTGTTVNTITKITGAPSTAVITATSDTSGMIGVTVGGAGTSGIASIQVNGIVSIVFDGATTAGDYVQISSTVAGNAHDTGSTSCPSSGQVVGRVLSTNASGGTYQVNLGSNGCGSSGGSSTISVNGSPVANPNINGSTPAAGSNGKNVTWQVSSSSVSGEIVGDGNAAHYLDGTGNYSTPAGGGSSSSAVLLASLPAATTNANAIYNVYNSYNCQDTTTDTTQTKCISNGIRYIPYAPSPLGTMLSDSQMCYYTDSSGPGGGTVNDDQIQMVMQAFGGKGCNNSASSADFYTGTYYSNTGSFPSGNAAWGDIEWQQVLRHPDQPADPRTPEVWIAKGGFDIFEGCGLPIGWGCEPDIPNTATAVMNAIAMYKGTQPQAKVWASNTTYCTRTGTWTATSTPTAPVAGGLIGSTGATLTCTMPFPNSTALYTAHLVAGGGAAGAASILVDSVGAGNLITNAAGSTFSLVHTSQIWWGTRFPVNGNTVHTIKFTVTTGPFEIEFITAPSPTIPSHSLYYPLGVFTGFQYYGTSTADAFGMNALEQTTTTQLAADGFNVVFADIRAGWPETYGATQWYEFIGTSATYPWGETCTGGASGGPHYADCGHKWDAAQVLKAIGKGPSASSSNVVVGDGTTIDVNSLGPRRVVSVHPSATTAMHWVSTWNSISAYSVGDTVVDSNGQTWINKVAISAPSGSPTLVQAKSTGANSTITPTSNVTSGNVLVLGAQYNCSATPPTDNQGNTWVLQGSSVPTLEYIWTTTASATGALTITACVGQNPQSTFLEFSGVSPTANANTSANESSGIGFLSPSITTTVQAALISICAIGDNPTTFSPVGAYTMVANLSGGRGSTAGFYNVSLPASTYSGGTALGCSYSTHTGAAHGIVTIALPLTTGNPAPSADPTHWQTTALNSLPTQAADTVLMNATGSTAAPTAVAMPTCTTGADLYNTTTHTWSCVSTGGGSGSYPTAVTVTPSAASSASLTSCINSSYRDYEIRISDLTVSDAAATIQMQYSTNNGSTWDTASSYQTGGIYMMTDGSASSTVSQATTTSGSASIALGLKNTSTTTASFDMRATLFNPLSTATYKRMLVDSHLQQNSDSHYYRVEGTIQYLNANAINAIKFMPSSGTFSGTIVCQPLPQ